MKDELLVPLLEELAKIVDRAVGPSGEPGRLGPVWAMRSDAPTEPSAALYTPMLCVVAQGAKQLLLGDDRFVYAPGRFLLNSVAVPAAGGVIEASEACPCLWVMIELDPELVREVVVEAAIPASSFAAPMPAMESSRIDLPTLEAVVRLARLFASPGDVDFLRPLFLREIVYRLLAGEQGPRLRQIASGGGDSFRILRAVKWLQYNFDKPMSVQALADECGLSPSSLHHHFKRVTRMSPLRFQKQLRLQEAKRLMVGENLDAASAGLKVGYEDASYFSRDYRLFFGAPPRRHVSRIRELAA